MSGQPTLAFISFASYGICPFGSTVRVTLKACFLRRLRRPPFRPSSANCTMSELVIEVCVDSLHSAQE